MMSSELKKHWNSPHGKANMINLMQNFCLTMVILKMIEMFSAKMIKNLMIILMITRKKVYMLI